mmetsp:Transcript_56493/g.175262  ORF Transcript_56493/g.175262 Transcript_56493/m.175262 type:complete len:211 (-) Transcript_56493:149-781(-)
MEVRDLPGHQQPLHDNDEERDDDDMRVHALGDVPELDLGRLLILVLGRDRLRAGDGGHDGPLDAPEVLPRGRAFGELGVPHVHAQLPLQGRGLEPPRALALHADPVLTLPLRHVGGLSRLPLLRADALGEDLHLARVLEDKHARNSRIVSMPVLHGQHLVLRHGLHEALFLALVHIEVRSLGEDGPHLWPARQRREEHRQRPAGGPRPDA